MLGDREEQVGVVTACSAYPPGTSPRCATTLRPSQEASTPSPTRSTTPATSLPGDGRQLGWGERARLAAAQARVEEVDSTRGHRDPGLAGGPVEVGQFVEDEVGGGSELVQPDRAHARHSDNFKHA